MQDDDLTKLKWTVPAESADILPDFVVEAKQMLDEAERVCLALETELTQEGIASAFRAFHTIKGVAGFLELGVLATLSHQIESVLAKVRDGATPPAGFVDLVLGAIDRVRACIDYAQRDGQGPPPDVYGFIRSLEQVAHGVTHAPAAAPPPPVVVEPPVVAAPPVVAPPVVVAHAPVVVAAPAAKPVVAAKPAERAQAKREIEDTAIRVDIGKMDHIIDLVGELAIAQAQVAAHPDLAQLPGSTLVRALAQVTRVVRDLQRASLAMRMVPIKGTFDRMARIARDTARGLDKAVTFATEGGHTELDRTMAEAIYDPLVHLVRNAIDHGLESRAERARRGKPENGTLTMRAFHEGGHVIIEIIDDGGGLDRTRILARARERGLISADAVLSDGEVDQLIFLPGFSTAEKVTSVSGRGVGMDVVRTNIERVRGRVDITSQPGAGSTFRLQLPLTLAIVDGILLGLGDHRYVLPATYVRDVFRPGRDQITTVQGRGEMVKVRGRLYPIRRLARDLHAGNAHLAPSEGVLVMVDDGAQPTCLLVDRLIGKQEVVVKTLGPMFAEVPGVAGGAILGDGRIALILDVPTLLASKRRQAA